MRDEATTFNRESQEKNCFECLQKRIERDLSDRLLFCYGVSDSPLPFGSSAVCQIELNKRDDTLPCKEDSVQFELVAVENTENRCLKRYIDRKILGNGTTGNRCEKDKPTWSKINGNQVEANLGAFEEEEGALPMLDNESHASDDHTNLCEETISALTPIAYAGYGSYKVIEELVCRYLSGSFEHSLMLSLILLLEGKSRKEAGTEFLSLLGLGNHGKNVTSKSLRHPNIAPILGVLQMPGYINLMIPKAPYTLENILHYSPGALKSDWHIRFLMYQLLSALEYIHCLGVTYGVLSPSSIKLTDSFWCWLSVLEGYSVRARLSLMNETKLLAPQPMVSSCQDNCPCSGLYADLRLTNYSDWQRDFKMWWDGELSNYEYLLILNRLAGRRWGDPTFHTVMPWVIDFSVKPDEISDAGWRDLRKSKWRLAKGDEQLDFTYSTSEIPHHVSDECLSELAVCSYKARRLPLNILRSAVRSVYEPNEYPSNMQRLYQWTPDECIPEFYTDPRIFSSVHDGMSNLAVPSWAGSPEEFISLHRAALESDRVSQEIHHWFDITFGYKLSGEAAVVAKNVTLPSSEPNIPRSSGRCQLFTQPHPKRRRSLLQKSDRLKPQQEIRSQVQSNCDIASIAIPDDASSCIGMKDGSMWEVANNLEEIERTMSFCEHNRHLSPCYNSTRDCINQRTSPELPRNYVDLPHPTNIDLNTLLECFDIVDDGGDLGFQELLLWKQKSSHQRAQSEDVAHDMFSVGCVLAELYLKRPLFDPVSLAAYTEHGLLPGLFQKLPPHVAFLVEECIQKDWNRRPSAYCLLDSPYFPQTVRSAYLFLAPLHLLTSNGPRLQFAAKLAGEGALRLMGSFAAEMCISYCMPLIMASLSDSEAEWASFLLKEFLRCLKPQAVIVSVLPVIQRVLQLSEYSHLKVLLLQTSFMREVWKIVGKRSYLQKIHPLVISNLYLLAHKNSASSASVLLIASCEEFGIPVTIHQTILPLINYFGKGLASDGIDSLVRIGGILGENFIVRQVLHLMRKVVSSCIALAHTNNPEPLQSWNSLALINSLDTLDGLVALLPMEVILKELVQDQVFLHVKILMHPNVEQTVIQVAGTTLLSICQKIGPDLTASHVLPQLRDLFDELAFSQETTYALGSVSKSGEDFTGSRAELLLLLYPSLASLLGIETFRRCCTTWLLLEQYLYKHYNWKWEHTGDTSRAGSENPPAQLKSSSKRSSSEYNPAKLLLNGVGWSVPQSQGARSGKSSVNSKSDDVRVTYDVKTEALLSSVKPEPWFWYPTSADSWDGPDFLNRTGGLKDEPPWKIRASILYTVRAHPGALRVLAVANDECTVFSGGVGSGFKGVVHQWELSRLNCVSGYYGHEEVVNDICILSFTERIASCDGSIHVWNSQTGKLLSCFSEPSATSLLSSSSSAKKVNNEDNGGTPAALSGGILSTAFNGSLYTCMHYLEFNHKLVAGMGNGSLRFLDIVQDQKLHLWKSQTSEPCFSSLVSAICSCGSDNHQSKAVGSSPSWVAAGLNSGQIRLLDARSGNVVALWRAHDGFITKLAAPEDHLLVSSSLDRTMSVWDLRRNSPNQRYIFSGYSGGVSGFSIWGQDMISVSGNKIGLSSLCHSEDRHQQVIPRKLYTSDRGARNMSALSSIDILPFSRLFAVGTEDGFLKICC